MDRLLQFSKSAFEKIKALSTGKKVILAFMLTASIVSVVIFTVNNNNNKNGLLYSNLPAADSKTVTEALKTKKIAYQVKGNDIYVPKEQVDSLKIEFAPSLSGDSKGYEIFDTTSQFGMTDEEFKIKKLRAVQGELEKTIKSIPQIENARVLLTIPDASAFVADTKPGKASVYLQMKAGMKLTEAQVKAIIAYVSGGVQEVPSENVEIIDDKLTLLSKNLSSTTQSDVTQNYQTQQQQQSEFEAKLQKNIINLLGPVYGIGKIVTQVSVDMDFDATEKTQVTYDPKSVVVSSHILKNADSISGDTGITQSPVDQNASNVITTTATLAPGTTPIPSKITSLDETLNYNVGQLQTKTIVAPGKVKRVTTSVMIDGTPLDANATLQLTNSVAGVIGFDATRNDTIDVRAIPFDPAGKKLLQDQIDALVAQTATDKKTQLYRTIATYGAFIAAFIVLLIMLSKLFKSSKPKKAIGGKLDVVFEEAIIPKPHINFDPIDMESESEKEHIQKEVKKYATQKPEQVIDIVKSWMAEEER